MTDLQADARTLFEAAVKRADPALALREHLARCPLPKAEGEGKTFLLALGKAAVPLMEEALHHVEVAHAALVVTNPENHRPVAGAEVLAGSHPVPDQASAAAGSKVIEFLAPAKAEDRVIALISGGGSALMVAPSAGLSLEDKAAVNQALLASGMEINEMNLIRQQLSELKGGGLLRHAAPASVHAYILSDVIGDDLRAIASGPTVAPLGSKQEAKSLLQASASWEDLPEAIKLHLSQPEVTSSAPPEPDNHLIGSNRHSLSAIFEAAQDQGWQATIVSDHLTGDVEDAADEILTAAKTLNAASDGTKQALIFGGETTVRLRGDGRGGRNQELALRVAKRGSEELEGNWLFLSGGTDGRDGPTDAAGGIVTAKTWNAIKQAGKDSEALLNNNDSYEALKAADALLMTGGTGTNVADVQIFLRLPDETT